VLNCWERTGDKLTTIIQTTDTDLIGSIAAHSQEGLSEAYRQHSGPVYGLALRLTRDRSLAEEVAQEVFVKLWQRPEAFDPERGTLRSFLLTIAHSKAIDVIRSEGARRTREETDGVRTLDTRLSIEEEILETEMAEQVQTALERLSVGERAAIELAYFGGHTYREVAEILGEPEGTVKSRIRSGLNRLSGTLQGYVR